MDLVTQLRADEVESLTSEIEAGRRGHILKSLDERGGAQELVRQQYSGRYPFELLQNANDAAAGTGHPGRVRFVLTDSALIVADNGAGFGEEEVRAICGLGRSSKDPRKSVGYKGLGFKSVGEITARPQIFSTGASFEFDDERVRHTVEQVAGTLDTRQRLPVYAFPFSLVPDDVDDDAVAVNEALLDGFSTVVRLPLRADASRGDVEGHLVESLAPRLLLFLSAIEELELVGTDHDFVSVVSRERQSGCDEVLLETNDTIEHWLVFRRSLPVERELVAPLGDSWSEVEVVHVAAGVRLSDDGLPDGTSVFPLHVYFPTEERTGLPVVVQADFALQLDRRQLATNPEATPYNDFLIAAASDLVGRVVAPALADRFPGDASTVAVVTPRGAGTGLGAELRDRCVEALSGARFLPAVDGRPRLPAEALLLPGSAPAPDEVHAFLDLDPVGRLVVDAVERDPDVRSFLVRELDVSEWALEDCVLALRQPEDDAIEPYYELLVGWAQQHGSRAFAQALGDVRFIRTATAEWVSPKEKVFFPRRRDDVEIPIDLPVPIAAVPEVPGLDSLLSDAGVRAFEWRELLTDYLLPLLVKAGTPNSLRSRAIDGLSAYYASQRGGDPRLQRRILDVLLPGRPAGSSRASGSTALRPAGALYFGADWIGSENLEQIYGPFGEPEFLAAPAPVDSDERAAERDFFRWIGVADHPRMLAERTDQRDVFMCDSLWRHHHRTAAGDLWGRWWDSEEVEAARACPQGHPTTQQLRASYVLDRFNELVASDNAGRLLLLWHELAHRWSTDYAAATTAVFHCQHSAHGGERDRHGPSIFDVQLRSLAWVPAHRASAIALVRPSDAWYLGPETPRRIADRVPVLDRSLAEGANLAFAHAIGVIDAARPAPADLVSLLGALRDEYEAGGAAPKEIQRSARWAMRALNDALASASAMYDVPLLATYQGQMVFSTDPVVALDPLLAESFETHYPVLDADKDLRRLHERLTLRVLDDPQAGVKATPIPRSIREDLRPEVDAQLRQSTPYLAAVAVANTPSREEEVLRGLARLELVVCDELLLRYVFEETIIERPEAKSFIAVRQETVRGAIRRNIGTAHLEIDPATQTPDWYAFGPQLAQFLNVPTQGDAFAVLLMANAHERERYLASRRVEPGEARRLGAALQVPPEDELLPDVLASLHTARDQIVEAGGDPPTPLEDPDDIDAEPENGPESAEERSTEALPPLKFDEAAIEDADPVAAHSRRRRAGEGSGVYLGLAGPADHEQHDRHSREIGRRGERWSLEAERRRVTSFGGDPTAVVWRSERNPFAPYDIESLDEDGQRIYIEVKTTTSIDPADRFTISDAELVEALRHRSRYYVYRVFDASAATPRVLRFRDPIGLLAEGSAGVRLADASMWFGTSPDGAPPRGRDQRYPASS